MMASARGSRATKEPAVAPFDGFPRELPRFLAALEKNNRKEWFDAHRHDYEEHYLAPAVRFAEAIEPGLLRISKAFQVDARVNGSIMRIHRDTRFAKDKTPYKTGLFIRFLEGEGNGGSGFGVHIAADHVGMMGGMFGFDSAQLGRYREAVSDSRAGPKLAKAVQQVAAAGCRLNEPHYKKVPRGFAPDHPRAALLRHRALHGTWEASPAPKELFGKEAVQFCLDRFQEMRPVQKWLTDHV